MLVAGSESTSRSLMLATYYLLSYPNALARLRKKLDPLMPNLNRIASLASRFRGVRVLRLVLLREG